MSVGRKPITSGGELKFKQSLVASLDGGTIFRRQHRLSVCERVAPICQTDKNPVREGVQLFIFNGRRVEHVAHRGSERASIFRERNKRPQNVPDGFEFVIVSHDQRSLYLRGDAALVEALRLSIAS